jgi:membrane protease subunit HflC
VPTRDRRFIWVDTYARWRITDPLLFFQRVTDERGAQLRLDDILDGETRNAVANHDLIEIVRTSNRTPTDTTLSPQEEQEILAPIETGREQITREILLAATAAVADYGIELLDLQFKRINYVAEVQQDVFARMIAERQRIAEEFRSEGQGESARIQGERERDLAQIQSEAFRTSEELRGTADAEATQIYADAYNRDSGFYAFTKSLETYENTMDPNTYFILGTDSPLMQFIEGPN